MCKKITSVIARYWWGGNELKRKIHWKKWCDIAIPKAIGGMGFRDLQLFNQAMLAKKGWRLMTKPNSLCAKVLKGKYYPNNDFLSARRKKNSSHTWRAILHGREALTKGLIKRVGDGSSIRIFHDPWIPDNFNGRPLVRCPEAKANLVEELIDDNHMTWREDKLEENFIETDRRAIRMIPLGRFSEDTWAWTQEKSGSFTVRSSYRLLAMQRSTDVSGSGSSSSFYWKKLWRLPVPPKVRSFWWRVIKRFIPARQILKERHMEQIGFCHACGRGDESIFHALFECTWAKIFWQEMRDNGCNKSASLSSRLLGTRCY
jgi:hypothetical protein